MKQVHVYWNPSESRWDVVHGHGSSRAVLFSHADMPAAIQWAKDNGYFVHAHYVTAD